MMINSTFSKLLNWLPTNSQCWLITLIIICCLQITPSTCLAKSADAPPSIQKGTTFPPTGQRIRVEYDTTITKRIMGIIPYSGSLTKMAVGNLYSYDSSSIKVYQGDNYSKQHEIPRRKVISIYRHTGQRRPTMDGLGLGASIGTLAAFASVMGAPPLNDTEPRIKSIRTPAIIFIFSTVAGGVIGYFSKRDTWDKLDKSEYPLEFQLTFKRERRFIGIKLPF